MLEKLLEEAKGDRREFIAGLMKNVMSRSVTYQGASIERAPGANLKIKLTKS